MMMIGAHFLWVPLHFLNQQWSLSTLAYIFGVAGAARLITVPFINRFGDWSWCLLGIPAWALTLWLCLSNEDDPIPLYVCIPFMQVSNCVLPIQGLIQLKYTATTSAAPAKSDDAETKSNRKGNSTGKPSTIKPTKTTLNHHQAALRIFTASETLGYALATLFGGIVMEFGGGWRSCAWVQLAWLSLQCIVFLTSPTVHDDFRKCFIEGEKEAEEEEEQKEKVSSAHVDAPQLTIDSTTIVLVNGIEMEMSDKELFLYIKTDLFVLLCAHSINVLAYSIEFALFAVYFKQIFQWSSSWTGAAQMSGDLLAACVLFGSVCQKSTTSDPDPDPGPGRTTCIGALLKPPVNISIMLLSVVLLYALICVPIFAVAVIAQILMGSCYVFGLQACNEYFTLLSYGSRTMYRRITFYGRIFYDISFALAGFLGLFIYDKIDPKASFWMVVGLAFVMTITYTIKMTYFSRARGV